LTHFANPDLERFQQTNQLTVTVDPATCQLSAPWNVPTPCDSARDILTKAGLSFTTNNGAAGSLPTLAINGPSGVKTIDSAAAPNWATANAPKWIAALTQAGYPPKADPANFNWFMIELILVIMVIYVTMVYGPIAAFLVELFPTKIRYTSMSLPYHIGNGWFGGLLPLVATALVAASGNIYYGLWYPIGVAIMTFIIGSIFLTETKDTDIVTSSGISVQGKLAT
jgi:hypothetical protein